MAPKVNPRRSGGSSPQKDKGAMGKLDKIWKSPAVGIKSRTQKDLSPSKTGSRYSVLEVEEIEDRQTVPPMGIQLLEEILGGVKKSNCAIEEINKQLGVVSTEVSMIRHDMTKMRDRISRPEEEAPKTEKRIKVLEEEVNDLKKEKISIKDKLTDLEDRSRRCNIRMVGFPGGAEGGGGDSAIQFCSGWLKDVIGEGNFTPMFGIEQAHRVPRRIPPPGGPPRTILIKLYTSQDRDTILRRAREVRDLQYNGQNIFVYPDFSWETQRKRASFREIKRQLKNAGVPFSLLFPTRLRVEHKGKVIIFGTSQEVSDWMDKEGM
ncbi:small muscular protein isoform X1 [Hyla sarda]|uniref:small muscular protein isoform X1 n=1 Tax=Hyla sarda TaxID=327740 RepID=UPI0024C2C3EA|nr:small muscular protein isoform X1 [Hyla sarda]